MRTSRPTLFPTLLLTLLAVLAPGAVETARAADDAESQLAFGVQMARRGLWSEALFRFQQAERLDGSNPRVLNNLAVAYEAVGRFDEALAAYQTALKAAPGNRDLKQNYARFVEFYQAYKPDGPEPEAETEGETAEAASNESEAADPETSADDG